MFSDDLNVIVVCFGVIFGWSLGDLGVFLVDLFVVLMILKVYDVNQITGNVLYRPMINYINKTRTVKEKIIMVYGTSEELAELMYDVNNTMRHLGGAGDQEDDQLHLGGAGGAHVRRQQHHGDQ